MLSVISLVGLAILWGIVLIPSVVQRVQHTRSLDTIGAFQRNMSSLASRRRGRMHHHDAADQFGSSYGMPSSHAPVSQAAARAMAPRSAQAQFVRQQQTFGLGVERPFAGTPMGRQQVLQRRQNVVMVLVAAALLSLVGAFAFSGFMVYVHLLVDVLLVGYLSMLMSLQKQAQFAPQRDPRSMRVTQQTASNIDLRGYAPVRQRQSV